MGKRPIPGTGAEEMDGPGAIGMGLHKERPWAALCAAASRNHLPTSWGGRESLFYLSIYIYIYIHIYISSFKLLIVCLDYQNHPAALPTLPWPPHLLS